jgi:site-specific recombinase XerD
MNLLPGGHVIRGQPYLVNNDVPLQVVQEILRNSDFKTTAIYPKLNSKTKRAAVEKLKLQD